MNPQLVASAAMSQRDYKPDKKGANAFLEHNSLRIAGVLNLVGDVGFLANGWKTKNPHKMIGGTLYTLGGLNIAHYGAVDKKYLVQEVAERTAEFIESRGVVLPDNCELAVILAHKDRSSLAEFDRFLHQQPAKNTLGLYTAGAASLLGSGIQKYHSGQGAGGLAYGATSLGVKLASLVIPEKPIAKQDTDKKPNAIIEWVQEKPLRIFGYGSLISESLLALESYQEYKRVPGKGGYLWTALSSASYMGADLMMAISHKDPTHGDGRFTQGETCRICELAAEVIMQQPKQEQETLVGQVAEFVASQSEIASDTQSVRKSLHEVMQRKEEQRWADRAASVQHHTLGLNT